MDNIVSDPIFSGPVILAIGILAGFGIHRIINKVIYKRKNKSK